MHEQPNDADPPIDPGTSAPPPTPDTTPAPRPGPVIYCTSCGVQLRGLAIGSPCTNCGAPVGVVHAAARPTNGKAIASMVLGICSIVGCMLYGLPGIVCGILAIVFAKQVKQQVESGQAHESALGMSNAGRICGWVGLCLSIAMIVFMIGYMIFIFTMINTTMQNPNFNNPPSAQPFPPTQNQPQPVNPTPNP